MQRFLHHLSEHLRETLKPILTLGVQTLPFLCALTLRYCSKGFPSLCFPLRLLLCEALQLPWQPRLSSSILVSEKLSMVTEVLLYYGSSLGGEIRFVCLFYTHAHTHTHTHANKMQWHAHIIQKAQPAWMCTRTVTRWRQENWIVLRPPGSDI